MIREAYRSEAFKDAVANDVHFQVARNLLYLRRHRGISQAALAKAVGTSQSAIARMETGLENITLETLKRVINALGGRLYVSVPPSELAPQSQARWWDHQPAANWELKDWLQITEAGSEQLFLKLQRVGTTLPGSDMIVSTLSTME